MEQTIFIRPNPLHSWYASFIVCQTLHMWISTFEKCRDIGKTYLMNVFEKFQYNDFSIRILCMRFAFRLTL